MRGIAWFSSKDPGLNGSGFVTQKKPVYGPGYGSKYSGWFIDISFNDGNVRVRFKTLSSRGGCIAGEGVDMEGGRSVIKES